MTPGGPWAAGVDPMSSTSGAPFNRDATLAQLNLHAVLPALEDLVRLSPAAQKLIAHWDFSLRLQLTGGPAATLVSKNGRLTVQRDATPPAHLVLLFLSASQLNRTFLNQKALPPIPIAGFWRLAKVRTFTALTKLLDQALQPAAGALADPAFREQHLRLLFKVLLGAIPVVGSQDPPSRHSLGHTPPGLAEIRAPALEMAGWADWTADGRLTSGMGPALRPPDVVITFCDGETTGAALLGKLDPNAAVGLGRVDVRGLVPLADGLSLVMDRVESYLQPAGPAATLAFTAAAA
jgi:hypothetical protein